MVTSALTGFTPPKLHYVLELTPALLRSAPLVAILGAAGTGKTSAIKALLRDRAPGSYRSYVHTSTTGISAINAGGTTINSLLRFYRRADLAGMLENGSLVYRIQQLKRNGCEGVVIDEISMMDGRTLDIIVTACDKASMPLVVVGDPGQLPPVESDEDADDGGGIRYFFQAESWAQFKVFVPTKVYRQQDGDFVAALNQVRVGHTTLAVSYLMRACTIIERVNQNYDGLTLVTKNQQVDKLNEIAAKHLKGPWFSVHAKREGKQRGEWKLIPDELRLCPGLHVMVLANHRNRYANGDLATVVDENPNGTVTVRLNRTGQEVSIERVRRTAEFAALGESGSVEYIPLRSAYAATFHKSQSLTLPKTQVCLRSISGTRDSYARRLSGGLYTAISRVQTAAGLTIVGDRLDIIKATYVAREVQELVAATAPVAH